MAKSDGKSGGTPSPSKPRQPMSSEPVDITWDDDTVPRLDFDDASFDRVTAIPEMPPELMAKQMMDHPGEDDPKSGLFGRGAPAEASAPPEPPVPSLPATPPANLESPLPFELEGAVLSSKRGAPARQSISTAPPPPRGGATLELDEAALADGAAARGRWAREAGTGIGETAKVGRPSLELDLSGLDTASPVSEPALRQIADRYATGDYSGALVLAEGILEGAPGHAEALRYAQNCRDVLTQMYAGRLGSLDQRVSMSIPSDQIRWLSLDHRAGFLLSLVDGNSSVEELLDISGMPRLDALRIIYSLFQERVIALTPRGT